MNPFDMTGNKKGKTPPSDDFIDQLLADVGDAGSSSEDSNPMISIGLQDDEEAAPVGLGSDEIQGTKVNLGQDNPWENIQIESPAEPLLSIPEVDIPDEKFPTYQEAASGYNGPSSGYDGPSSGYDIMGSAGIEEPVAANEDRTVAIGSSQPNADSEATVAVTGFAGRKPQVSQNSIEEKVVIGSFRGSSGKSGNVMTSMDASLAQSESLKIAQKRILELENEVDKLRSENDSFASSNESMRSQFEEVVAKLARVESSLKDVNEVHQAEVLRLKATLEFKESESSKARLKTEELEGRVKADFKKVRVKERELENRLELLKAEKTALLKSKDDHILEIKNKMDSIQGDLASYRTKCSELNQTIEANQEQFKRTIRALRLALGNLEAKDQNVTPLKKAE